LSSPADAAADRSNAGRRSFVGRGVHAFSRDRPVVPRLVVDSHRLVFLLSAALSTAYAAVFVGVRLYEFADGAWFSFALALDKPFKLVWANYSGRLGSYVLYVLPAQLLMRLSGSPRLALAFDAALYGLTPVFSLLACYGVLGKDQRWRIVWPAVFFMTVGMLTWGFPTEVWLTGALAWPLLFLLQRSPPRRRDLAPIAVLTLLLVFSHEAWIVVAPFLALVVVRRWSDPGVRRLGWAWAVIAVLAAALWLAAKRLLPQDPLIAQALSANAKGFFDPLIWLHNVTALKFILLVAVFCGASLIASRTKARAAQVLWLSVGLAAIVIFIPHRFNGVSRYTIRGAVVFALIALMACAVVLDRARAQAVAPRSGMAAAPLRLILPALIAANLVENYGFVRDYVAYRAAVAAQERAQGGDLALAGRGVTSQPARWEWSLPFQSFLLSDPRRGGPVIYTAFGRGELEPLGCAAARGLERRDGPAGRARIAGMVRYACLDGK
jgi:hypothetical protein